MSRWSIVLAGGEGARLRPYVERCFGQVIPKQYCAFAGDRSMLQETIDRATRLSGNDVAIVTAAHHERWAAEQLAGFRGHRIAQPANRETGPGIYLPLAYVRARDPDAVVYLLPSDHDVRPSDRFVAQVAAAGERAARRRDELVLLGVSPTDPDGGYGYIEAGPDGRVQRFVEKPGPVAAAAAIARGAAWNTMVIAATAGALWDAGRACIPDVLDRLEAIAPALGTRFEGAALERAYDGMPFANFSRDVLEQVCDRCVLALLDGVEWSDWGEPARIEASLRRAAGA
jgi:mannose-1-phosphate guanylyltransferase